MRNGMRVADWFAVAVFLSGSFAAQATDTAWTGAVDDDWNKAGNWSVKVPAGGDIAYFTNTPNVSVRVTADATAILRIYSPITLTLEAGVTLSLTNSGSEVLTSSADVTINGPGTILPSTKTGDDHADFRPGTGTTLTINAKVTGTGTSGFEHNGLGKIVLTNPANDFPGTVVLTQNSGSIGSTLEFSDVGALGNAPSVKYSNYYTALRYTGGTATLAKDIWVNTGANNGRDITFYNGGTGTLSISGKIDSGSNYGKAITLYPEAPAGGFVLSGAVTNSQNSLYLYSNGKGTVTLNGPVNIGGQLRSIGTSTLIAASSSPTVAGSYQADAGTTFILAGNAVLGNGSITLVAATGTAPGGSLVLRDSARTGTGTLTLNAGTSLTLSDSAALSNASVTVSAGLAAYNTVRIALNASGTAPAFQVRIPTLTVNNGGVVALDLQPAASGAGALSVNTLNLADSATLAISAPAIGTDASRVFAANLADGPVAKKIALNGFPATYSAAAGLTPVIPAVPGTPANTLAGIPALGPYTIPSTNGTAAIDTQGTGGPLTIGESLTSLGALLQSWSADPATLDLAGNTLATPLIQIAAAGNSLTLTNGTASAPGLPPAGETPVNQPAFAWLTDDASAGIASNGVRVFTHLLDFGNQGSANAALINGLQFTKVSNRWGTVTGTDSRTYGFTNFYNVFTSTSLNNWTNVIPATATGLRALLLDMSYEGFTLTNATLTGLTPGATYELRLFNRSWDGFPNTTQRTQSLSFIPDPSDPNPPTVTFDPNNMAANVLVLRYVPTGTTLTLRSRTVSGTSNPFQPIYGLSNEKISDTAVGVSAVTRVPALTLDNQNAAATLTLAAPLTDNAGQLAVVKSGAGAAVLSDPRHTGGTVLLGGSLALDIPAGADRTLNGPVSGAAGASLIKSGAGTLRLTAPNTHLGPTVVQSGTLVLGTSDALGADGGGAPAAGTEVQSGGALDINGLSLGREFLTFRGAGPDGSGALINTGARAPNNSAFAYAALSGDATVGSAGIIDFRYGTFNFNGHSLVKSGNGQLHFGYLAATNVAESTAIDVQQGMLMLADGTSLAGSETNVITLRNGASLGFYNTAIPLLWSVVVADGATSYINAGSGTATNVNLYAGPVTIGTGSTLAISNSSTAVAQTFSGPISGPGSLTRAPGSAGETYLRGTNTYAGTTTVYSGGLHTFGAWALPGYAEAGRVENRSWLYAYTQGAGNPAGWTVPELKALYDTATFTGTSTLIFNLFDNLEYPHDIVQDPRLYVSGAFTANLNGHFTYPNAATNGGIWARGSATVNVNSDQGDYYVGYVAADGGTLNFTNRVSSIIRSGTGNDILVQNNGVLNLSGGNTLVGHVKTYNSGGGKSIYGPNGKGVINVTGGATLQGKLYIGINSNSTAASTAIYVDGGTLHNTGGAGNDSRIGHQGYGYLQLDSGTFTNNGYTQLGSHFSGVGILRQNGGTFSFAGGTASTDTGYYGGRFALSRGGTGVLHIAGGAFNSYSPLSLGETSDNSGTNGLSVMTVEGTGNVFVPFIDTANRTNHLTVINLNGGDLATRYIWRANRSGNESRVNLNGTIICPQVELNPFFHNDSGVTPPVTRVWPGSACFNVTNSGILTQLISPLLAPEGNGIQAIAVSGGGSGYIAPPHVNIFGGGGNGATAIALINRSSGAVTNITVTSPGTGYTSTPTVTLSGGGGSGAAIGTITRGLNPSTGGLFKTGLGTLALLGSGSTYGGPTVVNGGTLLVGAQDALPPRSNIKIGDGTLDLAGHAVTNGSVTISGSGAIINGKLTTARFVKTGAETATLDATVALIPPTSSAYGQTPGLLEGMINSSWNTNMPNPVISTQLTTRAGNGVKAANTTYAGGLWNGNNHTWIYSGYLWNRQPTNVVWTWRFTFDDNVMLMLDGALVRYVNLSSGVQYQNTTLTPGPHAIEIRFGDGSGDVGPASGLGGLTYDPLGRNSTTTSNYILLQDPGDGSLLTVDDGGASGLPVSPVIQVAEGTLRIPPPATAQPGLYEGRVSGNQNWAVDNPKDLVTLNIRSATGKVSSGGTLNGATWPDNTTYIHTGYLWNRQPTNVVWTFGENFDDTALLYIDGARVLYDTASATPTYKNATLTPGPHAFELRLAQGTGSVGGNWTRTDGLVIGFGVDRQGRNANVTNNYEALVDPGDGSLFTTTSGSGDTNLLYGVTIEVASGASLDLGGVTRTGLTLTGGGTVSNAVFGGGMVISPAGDTNIGTLALESATFAGAATYRVTIAGDTVSDLLTSSGALDLSALTIVPANTASAAPTGKSYVIIHAAGGFTGTKPSLSGFDPKWNLFRIGNDLVLTSQRGTVLSIQ